MLDTDLTNQNDVEPATYTGSDENVDTALTFEPVGSRQR